MGSLRSLQTEAMETIMLQTSNALEELIVALYQQVKEINTDL